MQRNYVCLTKSPLDAVFCGITDLVANGSNEYFSKQEKFPRAPAESNWAWLGFQQLGGFYVKYGLHPSLSSVEIKHALTKSEKKQFGIYFIRFIKNPMKLEKREENFIEFLKKPAWWFSRESSALSDRAIFKFGNYFQDINL